MHRLSLIVYITIAAFMLLSFSSTASAHRSGCHAWHSCPSDTGSYVCGDTGHYNYCSTNLPATNSYKIPSPQYSPLLTASPPSSPAPLPITLYPWDLSTDLNRQLVVKALYKGLLDRYPEDKTVLTSQAATLAVDGNNIRSFAERIIKSPEFRQKNPDLFK